MGNLIYVIVLLGIYFLPAIVACLNKKKNAGGVFVLNTLLGWTGIGWIIALIWAVCMD